MTIEIHPTAIVADGAKIQDGVSIGPYCVIGEHVCLKENVKVHGHVIIEGHTTIGQGTEIFPFTALGLPPQNIHYHQEASKLEIGENCIIREHVTIHRGTEKGRMKTTVGNNCFIMVGAHIAHDCHIGNFVVMANNATLGGHVTVGDYANIGGLAAIHQFVRIGAYVMISGTAGVSEDVMPYGAVSAMKAKLGGLNIIGMKRRGFKRQDIHDLRSTFKLLARDQTEEFDVRLDKVKSLYGQSEAVKHILSFIEKDPKRPLCLPAEGWEFEINDMEEKPSRAASA